MNPEYERVLDGAAKWLNTSGGSAIPEGFTPIDVESYAPGFQLGHQAVKLDDSRTAKLTEVGEGAFALVYRFTDPNYGLTSARKRLKLGSDEREKERFRREFDGAPVRRAGEQRPACFDEAKHTIFECRAAGGSAIRVARADVRLRGGADLALTSNGPGRSRPRAKSGRGGGMLIMRVN